LDGPADEQQRDHLLFGTADDEFGHAQFGHDDSGHDDSGHDSAGDYVPGAVSRAQRRRSERDRRGALPNRHGGRRKRRRRRIVTVLSLLIIAVVVVCGWFFVGAVRDRFVAPDYSGPGHGSTQIRIAPGDSANTIGDTMADAGVVKSARAFVNAAKDSGKSDDIQPGVYRVPLHSSGSAAVAAILDPDNRLISKVTIPEGYTEKQILAALADKTGLSLADLTAAADQISNLGLPDGMAPKSAEGFLFPATYQFDPGMSAEAVVQELTAQFDVEYRKLDFAADAAALHLTPYQVLIIASLVESEAKFPQDRPKIARVILNRLASDTPIGIDASNRYGVALQGKDPDSTTYQENSPYNVRLHTGLPPTPVSNPGEASMVAALHPAAGDWLYYVVSDAAGHHEFTADPKVFEAAQAKCESNGWCD